MDAGQKHAGMTGWMVDAIFRVFRRLAFKAFAAICQLSFNRQLQTVDL